MKFIFKAFVYVYHPLTHTHIFSLNFWKGFFVVSDPLRAFFVVIHWTFPTLFLLLKWKLFLLLYFVQLSYFKIVSLIYFLIKLSSCCPSPLKATKHCPFIKQLKKTCPMRQSVHISYLKCFFTVWNRLKIVFLCPRLNQCEEDKVTKDSQIKSLQEELMHQEELVAKLQKEKKSFADNRQKVS